MKQTQIYDILRGVVDLIRIDTPELRPLPAQPDTGAPVKSFGITAGILHEIEEELELRLDGRALEFTTLSAPNATDSVTIGQIMEHIGQRTAPKIARPEIVYVDDEEENLFVFRRRFGKDFTIETFDNPRLALEHILTSPNVALVITDEVMPGLRGNQLCDEVRKYKPYMKFILLTANPEQDDFLMYNSLRRNRFFDFLRKPVDFDARYNDYVELFRSILP